MQISEDTLDKALKQIRDVVGVETRTNSEDMFLRYMGEPYGDEREGKSKYVATDVSDTVETYYAEALEVIMGDDHLVSFAPVGPEDEGEARQETEVLHHLLREQNNSFEIMSTWLKEGLIQKCAYVRAGWVEKTKIVIDEYEDLSLEDFQALYSEIDASGVDYDIEELEGATVDDAGVVTADADMISTRIRSEVKSKQFEIEPIPQNEIFVSGRWNRLTLGECPEVIHRTDKTRAELRSLGFSEKSISMLATETSDSMETTRHTTTGSDDGTGYGGDEDDYAVCECYVRLSDDDTTRTLKIWTSGDGASVLDWEDGDQAIEEVERAPFVSWSPIIIPHKNEGRSVAELAAPAQKLNTVLMRTMLDNTYANANVRPMVLEGGITKETMEALTDADGTSVIPMTQLGAVTWTQPPNVLGDILPLLQKSDMDLQKRVGASNYAQGLSDNALSKSQIGSEGAEMVMSASMRRIQGVIRTFAEIGLRELFLLMHSELRRGPAKELALKLRGQWITANPRSWRERTDVSVRVGTGRQDTEKRLMALNWTLNVQKELLASGSPYVTPVEVYETLRQIAIAQGLKNPEQFFLDPATTQVPPPTPPEPSVQEQAQMKLAEAEMLKAQAQIEKAKTDRADKEAEMAMSADKTELERQVAGFEAQKATSEMELKNAEMDIREKELELKRFEVIAKYGINPLDMSPDDAIAAVLGQSGEQFIGRSQATDMAITGVTQSIAALRAELASKKAKVVKVERDANGSIVGAKEVE